MLITDGILLRMVAGRLGLVVLDLLLWFTGVAVLFFAAVGIRAMLGWCP
jgi:hypothetical protein